MPGLTVTSNIDHANSILSQLSRGKINTAARQAVNRVATTVRKEASADLITQIQPRRKGDVSKHVTIEKASAARAVATISVTNESLGLDKIKTVRVQSFKRGKRRVQRVTWRGKEIKGAFRPINLVKGNKAIFRQAPGKYRTGNRKVKRLYAYPILQEFEHAAVEVTMFKTVNKRWPVEFTRAINNQLRRLTRRQAR